MVLKSVGVFSVAKIMGALYAAIGFIGGCFVALFSVVGAGLAGGQEGVFAMVFGVGAVFILPVFYGVLGFVAGALGSVLYNFVAGVAGGIELNLE